jgi:hypothetical protein
VSALATVPAVWLAAVAKLLNEMAGEGIFFDDCEDPCDLLLGLAEHLGLGMADDPWQAAMEALNATDSPGTGAPTTPRDR